MQKGSAWHAELLKHWATIRRISVTKKSMINHFQTIQISTGNYFLNGILKNIFIFSPFLSLSIFILLSGQLSLNKICPQSQRLCLLIVETNILLLIQYSLTSCANSLECNQLHIDIATTNLFSKDVLVYFRTRLFIKFFNGVEGKK